MPAISHDIIRRWHIRCSLPDVLNNFSSALAADFQTHLLFLASCPRAADYGLLPAMIFFKQRMIISFRIHFCPSYARSHAEMMGRTRFIYIEDYKNNDIPHDDDNFLSLYGLRDR